LGVVLLLLLQVSELLVLVVLQPVAGAAPVAAVPRLAQLQAQGQ
jgi:hypothetical protein